MTIEELLPHLHGVRPRGTGKWSARCPAHPDRTPSLSVAVGNQGILLKCFAACSAKEICSSLNLEMRDLFFDAPDSSPVRRRPFRLDHGQIALDFELTAHGLRRRAERVLKAAHHLSIVNWSDTDISLAHEALSRAHADQERAAMFEDLADSFRMKAFDDRQRMEDSRAA